MSIRVGLRGMSRGVLAVPYDSFRRSHDIRGSAGGAQTYYQVKVKACYNDNAIFDAIGIGILADTSGFKTVIGGYEGTNPVIPCGAAAAWDERIREPGNVLYEPEDTGREYKTWFTAYIPPYGIGILPVIGYAYSSDGITWTKVQCVGVAPDAAHGAEDPYICKVGNIYYMYFELRDGTTIHTIARAYSTDCVNWTYEQIVLTALGFGFETTDVASPVNWYEDGIWYMLYEGRTGGGLAKIGLATSADGLAWNRDAGNPVFTPGVAGKFDDQQVGSVDCIKIGTYYYMTYEGYDGAAPWRPGLARSTNLTAWTRLNNGDALIDNAFSAMVYRAESGYVFHWWLRTLPIQDISGIYRGYPDFRESVSLGGRCQADFGDVRFMQGVTELDYWVEDQTDSSYAIIWVEVATIPVAGTTIDIYYGRTGLTTASDGDATFDFFEDFETDLTKWTLTVNDPPNSINLIPVPAPPPIRPPPGDIQCVELDDTDATPVIIEHYGFTSRDYRLSFYVRSNLSEIAQSVFSLWYDAPNDLNVTLALFDTFFQYYDVGWNRIMVQAANTWYKFEYVFRLGDAPPHFDLWIDEDNNFPLLAPPLGVDLDMRALVSGVTGIKNQTAAASVIKGYFDVFRVGKYVDPEPTHGDWGAQRTVVWPF